MFCYGAKAEYSCWSCHRMLVHPNTDDNYSCFTWEAVIYISILERLLLLILKNYSEYVKLRNDIYKLCLEKAESFCCIVHRTLGCIVDHLFFIEIGRSYYWRIIKPTETSKCWQATAIPNTTQQPVGISKIKQTGLSV